MGNEESVEIKFVSGLYWTNVGFWKRLSVLACYFTSLNVLLSSTVFYFFGKHFLVQLK